MGRLIAIGEINGDYDKLQDTLDAIEPTGKDELIFLGNYVGSAPQSANVIERLIRFRKYGNSWFIAGSKDKKFINYLRGKGDAKGLKSVLESYGNQDVPWQHYEFLALLSKPITIPNITESNLYTFSHEPITALAESQYNIHATKKAETEKHLSLKQGKGQPIKAVIIPKMVWGNFEFIGG